MTPLPLCRWRGDETADSPPRHFCHSPAVHARDGAVSASLCGSCLLADHEPPPAHERRPDPPAAPPCRFRGDAVGRAPCASCRGTVYVPLKRCLLPKYGVCTDDPAKKSKGVHSCVGCKEAVAPDPEPRELLPGLPDPIPGPQPERLPSGWHERPGVRDAHVAALRHLASCPLPGPAGPRAGDGIVIAGGGKYWPGAVICATLARESGCTLPIQIWHRGSHGEAVRPADVAGLGGVEVIDIDRHSPGRRAKRGWETKTHAVIHSGFARVLFLDSDAYPVIDPTALFSALVRAPFAFWRDTGERPKAPWFGLAREAVEAVPPVQSGQYLVDVAGWWRELVLAYWMDQHSDYFYSRGSAGPRGRWHGFGDQAMLTAALAATGGPYHEIGPAKLDGWRFTYDHGGRTCIVHRHGSKLFPGTSPRRDDSLPLEARVFALFARLTL